MSPDNHNDIVEKYKQQLNLCLGRDDWDLRETDSKTSYSEKLSTGKWALRVTSHTGSSHLVASFELHPMINCCGICVSTRAEVYQEWRGRGLGTLLNSFRIDVARHNGYGLLLCTDVVHNEPQRKVLKANGWRDIHQFVNPRTGNRVAISVINL